MDKMVIEYGVSVEDKNGNVLGTVDHIIRDTWTGEQRKFVVRREDPQVDLYFSPEQVTEATSDKVKLNLSLEELQKE